MSILNTSRQFDGTEWAHQPPPSTKQTRRLFPSLLDFDVVSNRVVLRHWAHFGCSQFSLGLTWKSFSPLAPILHAFCRSRCKCIRFKMSRCEICARCSSSASSSIPKNANEKKCSKWISFCYYQLALLSCRKIFAACSPKLCHTHAKSNISSLQRRLHNIRCNQQKFDAENRCNRHSIYSFAINLFEHMHRCRFCCWCKCISYFADNNWLLLMSKKCRFYGHFAYIVLNEWSRLRSPRYFKSICST